MKSHLARKELLMDDEKIVDEMIEKESQEQWERRVAQWEAEE